MRGPRPSSPPGADLFLAEASFQTRDDNPPDLHLTGADCGRTALAAGVGRLVLTHVPPWHDAAVAEAEARGGGRAGWTWHAQARRTRSERSDQAGVVDDHRDLHPVGRVELVKSRDTCALTVGTDR